MGDEGHAIAGLEWTKMTEANLQKIAETWITLYYLPEDSQERRENFWAFNELVGLCNDDPESCWKVIHLIRQLDGNDKILANLAAGPLEDLLVYHGNDFIDRIESLAKKDPQFKKLLGAVWQRDTPDSIWKRVKAVAAPSW